MAQAAATADEAGHGMNPMAMRGLPTDIFTLTRGQDRLAASIGTPMERANDTTRSHGQAGIQPTTESLSTKGGAGAGRAEGLIPGLGGNGGDALLGLLGGLPAGGLLGNLTGEGSPLGQLLGNGPLSSLLGTPKKASANDGGASGAAPADWPRTQEPAARGDDAADWRQARPAAQGTVAADPAYGGAPANPTWRPPTLSQPATHQMDATAGREPAPGANNGGDGLTERQPVAGGKPFAGGMLGPDGPLSRVEILGGDTLASLPLVGDLLGGGLSLNTLNNLPGISNLVNQIGSDDAGKMLPSLGNVPAVGKLSRTLLNGESATAPTEAADTRRGIDKTKVTPQLLPLFGPDALGIQALSGMIHQLPPVG